MLYNILGALITIFLTVGLVGGFIVVSGIPELIIDARRKRKTLPARLEEIRQNDVRALERDNAVPLLQLVRDAEERAEADYAPLELVGDLADDKKKEYVPDQPLRVYRNFNEQIVLKSNGPNIYWCDVCETEIITDTWGTTKQIVIIEECDIHKGVEQVEFYLDGNVYKYSVPPKVPAAEWRS
jgi:hypothetical protein